MSIESRRRDLARELVPERRVLGRTREERRRRERRRRPERRRGSVERLEQARGSSDARRVRVGSGGGHQLREAVEEPVHDRDLFVRAGGVAERAFELAREVASQPRGQVGVLERAELGDRRGGGSDVALEQLRDEVFVDAVT